MESHKFAGTVNLIDASRGCISCEDIYPFGVAQIVVRVMPGGKRGRGADKVLGEPLHKQEREIDDRHRRKKSR